MTMIIDGTKGGFFPSWTTATRPATPTAWQQGYNSTLGSMEFYNGTTWLPCVSSYTASLLVVGAGGGGGNNLGGGGGGGSNITSPYNGGSGGSGIVIISYAGSQRGTGGTVTSSGGNTIHTFTSSGTYVA